MRKLLLLALLLLLSNFGQAQTTGPGFVIYVGSAPSGTCSAGAYQENVIGLGTVYTCQSGTWTQVSGGGGSGVTSVATTTPITGGTITGTGTIACATCVKATSPGAGIAHFAGSTQEVTSSLIVAADITSATITGTQIASSVALAGSPTTTTQSASDNSTKIATTAYVDAVSSAFTKVGSCQVASASASLDITSLSSTYNIYDIEVFGVTTSANTKLGFQLGSGSFDTGAVYSWAVAGGTPTATGYGEGATGDSEIFWRVANTTLSTSGSYSGTFRLTGVNGNLFKHINGTASWDDNSANIIGTAMNGSYHSTSTTVDRIRLIAASGTLTTGTMCVYGISK